MSDYTPPTLVIPTPGGNPGDGSIGGALTIGALNALTSYFQWLKVGKNGAAFADIDTTGNTNFYPLKSGGGTLFGGGLYIRGQNSEGGNYFGISGTSLFTSAQFSSYLGISTVGLGVAPLYGKDVRTGLTAVDSAAKTLYTTTAAGQVYEVAARIFGAGGTIDSGIYTVGWTEGGTARTDTVSITAAGTMDSAVFLLQPDNGTAITGQLTTLSGTTPSVNVAAILKEDV